jgi:hypothetical protein
MARGLAKVQSQEKHAKKMAKVAVPIDGKAARAAQLKFSCSVCKVLLSPLVASCLLSFACWSDRSCFHFILLVIIIFIISLSKFLMI